MVRKSQWARDKSFHEQILGHGGQLVFGLPIALPAVAGVAVPDQAHAAHVGAVEDGTHAPVIAACELVLRALTDALLFLAAAVSDQRGQHAVAHGREGRLVLEQQERATRDRAARCCWRIHGRGWSLWGARRVTARRRRVGSMYGVVCARRRLVGVLRVHVSKPRQQTQREATLIFRCSCPRRRFSVGQRLLRSVLPSICRSPSQ